MDSFLSGGKKILKHFPDNQELDSMEIIQSKSDILYLGMDLSILDYHKGRKEGTLSYGIIAGNMIKTQNHFFICSIDWIRKGSHLKLQFWGKILKRDLVFLMRQKTN